MPKANVNGINLFYKVQGQGEPLVMIQGYSGGHDGWFFQTRVFKKHYKTITFDPRGIGKSDKPAEPYTVRTMADDVIKLMDHLNIEKAHVLGISLGGIVAQELAINYPQRLMKLVLASTTTGEENTDDIHPELLQALGVEAGATELDGESVDFIKAMDTIINLAFSKKLYRILLLPMAKLQMKRVGIEGHRRQMEAVSGHSTLDRLHLIEAPTLVITGTADRIVSPRSSETIASRLPDAKLVMIEGGSHAMLIEMRGRFNKEILDFLRNTGQ